MQYLYRCPVCQTERLHQQSISKPLPPLFPCPRCSFNYNEASQDLTQTMLLQPMNRVYEPAMTNFGERSSHDAITNFQMRNLG